MSNGKHMREIELSRRLADIFRMVPYENHLNFLTSLLGFLGDDKQSSGLEIQTELSDGKGNRYDIVLPLSIGKIKNIIFELKLDRPDGEQLERYAKSDALIVSLAKTPINDINNQNVVSITWSDLFDSLFQLLGFDARDRLGGDIKASEPSLRLVSPDLPRPISKTLELYIEDYLRDILKAGLVPSLNRVFVGTGEKATGTTSEYNVYTYLNNWNHNYQYVCIVYQNRVQYIGKVEEKYPNISIQKKTDEVPPVIKNNDTNETINDDKITECVSKLEQDPFPTAIVKLKMIFCRKPEKRDESACKPWLGAINDHYGARGPFTMSHRYFNSPEDFVKAFTAGRDNQDR